MQLRPPIKLGLNDLCHSFAYRAVALGESLPMIGNLFGHTQPQTTACYAHLVNESVEAPGSRVSGAQSASPDPPGAALASRRIHAMSTA